MTLKAKMKTKAQKQLLVHFKELRKNSDLHKDTGKVEVGRFSCCVRGVRYSLCLRANPRRYR